MPTRLRNCAAGFAILLCCAVPALAQPPVFDGGSVGIMQGKLQRFQLVWQASFTDRRPYAYDVTSYDFADTFGPDGARVVNTNVDHPVIWASGTGYSTNGQVPVTLDISCPVSVKPGLYERTLPMRVNSAVVCYFKVRVQVYPQTVPTGTPGTNPQPLPAATGAPVGGKDWAPLSQLLRGAAIGSWIKTPVTVGGVEYLNSFKGHNIEGTGVFSMADLATAVPPQVLETTLAVTDETDAGRVYIFQVQLDNQPATQYRVTSRTPRALSLDLSGVTQVSISAMLLRGYAAGAKPGPVLLEPRIHFTTSGKASATDIE
ncbi:MAG: hypothetical protein ABFE07_25770 [Armatimonadia bacterium]